MPALDFPASPTNGQVFGNWVYNSTKEAWQSRPLTPAKTVNSPTAPVNPADGDQWFNTNTGQLFIYFVDANGGQWVESRAPITADGYVSPNYVINGGFDIWQRGTSFSSQLTDTKANSADRWNVNASSTTAFTVTRQSVSDSLIPHIQYSLRFQRNSGSAITNGMYMVYNFESNDSIPLAGKTVTFSFYARKGANFSQASSSISAELRSSTGVDGNLYNSFPGAATVASIVPTLTTSWQRFQTTGSVPATAKQLAILFNAAPTGTAGANDWFEITGVQVEEGSVATPFRRNANSIQGELAACQRYYQVMYAGGADINIPVVRESAVQSVATYICPVPMRANPSLFTGSTAVVSGTALGRIVVRDTAFNVAAATCNFIQFYAANPSIITFAMSHGSLSGSYIYAEFDTLGVAGALSASAEL